MAEASAWAFPAPMQCEVISMELVPSGDTVTVLAITSNSCNMDCSYCFRDHSAVETLTFEVFEAYMRNMDSFFPKETPLCVIFHGGEPLLAGYQFFERAFNFLDSLDRKIYKGMQSNLTLLDESLIELFKKNDCSIGGSLDGDSEVNDQTRHFKNHKGSYAIATEKLRQLKLAGMYTGVISVLHDGNMNAQKYHRFTKQVEAYQIGFSPMFEYRNSIASCTDPEKLAQFLIALFDLWVEDDNPPKLTLFEEITHSMLGKNPSKTCVFHEDCTRGMMAVNVNGDVCLCNHFLGMEEHCYGNAVDTPFNQIWNSVQRENLKRRSILMASICKDCEYRSICHGGCMSHTFESFSNRDYFCKAYRLLFAHIEEALMSVQAGFESLSQERARP
jgi:uncharacterized protein